MILKLKYYLESPQEDKSDYEGYIISIDIDEEKIELIQNKERLNKVGRYSTFIQRSGAFIDTTKKITKTAFYPVMFNGNEPTPKPNDPDPIYVPFVEFLLNGRPINNKETDIVPMPILPDVVAKRPINNKETDIGTIENNHSFKEDNFPPEIVGKIKKKFGSFTEFQYINKQYLDNLKGITPGSKNLPSDCPYSFDFTGEVKNFIKHIEEYEKDNPKSKRYQYVKNGRVSETGEDRSLFHYSLRLPKLRIYLKPPKSYLERYFNNSEEEFLTFFHELTVKKLKVSRKPKKEKTTSDSQKRICPLCHKEKDLFCSNFETNSSQDRTYIFQNLDKKNIRFKVCSECNEKLSPFYNFIKKQKNFLVKFNNINSPEDARKYSNAFISTYKSDVEVGKTKKFEDKYPKILAFLDKQIQTEGIFEGSLTTFDGKSVLFDDYYIKNKATPVKDEEVNLIQLNQWINLSNSRNLSHNELYRIVKRCFFSENSYWFTTNLSKIKNPFYKEISKYINNNYELLKEIYLFNFDKVNVNAFCNMSLELYFFYLQFYIHNLDDSADEEKKKKNKSYLKSTLKNFPVVFSFLLKKIIKEDGTMNELQNEITKLKQIGHYLSEIDSERKNNGETEDEKKQIITQLDTTNYDALIFSLVKLFDRYKHIEIKKNSSYSAANDILIKNKEHFKNDKVLFSEAVMYIVSGYLENNGGN